jgi:hypothetical protein
MSATFSEVAFDLQYLLPRLLERFVVVADPFAARQTDGEQRWRGRLTPSYDGRYGIVVTYWVMRYNDSPLPICDKLGNNSG